MDIPNKPAKPFLAEYEKYCKLSIAKHEEPFSFKRWLSEKYNPPPKCKKCQRAKKVLLQRLK